MAANLNYGGKQYSDTDLQNLQNQKQIILSAQSPLTPSEIKSLRQRSKENNKKLFQLLRQV